MDLEAARQSLAAMQEQLSLEVQGWWPTALTAVVCLLVVLVSVPFVIVLLTKKSLDGGGSVAKKQRKMRRIKWTLDDPTQKKEIPIEWRDKSSIAKAVERYQKQKDSDSDSEEEDKILTPEQILAQHQEVPREPHVGIFIGVDDPIPSVTDSKNSRCATDAKDMAEAMGKLDYKTFVLQDHKSHKVISEGTAMPTRINFAQLLRSLKEGKYDDQTRKKPNTKPWENCLVYLATRVRIITYSNREETMEFLVRQEMEPEPVWIDLVELINKISDIPFRHLFVVLDIVHTGKDDIAFKEGEDTPNPGKPCPMSEILRRTGVRPGIVNSQRCSVIGITRPETLPKEMPPELLKGSERTKIRNGPLVHFLLAGLREVEKRDPNAEMWKTMSSMGGMGGGLGGGMGGGFGMMPTVAPVTSGDLSICPFHCGDMTVDSIYRFCSRKIRLLLKDPLNDPAYHVGSVKMTLAVQKAIRPRDTPETPPFMHECQRENIKADIFSKVKPVRADRTHVSVALLGAPGSGKSSLMLSTAWTKETLDSFSDGVFYFSLHNTLENNKKDGKLFVSDMQQSLARQAAAFEGQLQNYSNASHYLKRHFAGMKTLVLLDGVHSPDDLREILSEIGISDNEKAAAAVLVTTTKKEVADICTHTVEVPFLGTDESKQLVAATAGLISTDDLPKRAEEVMSTYRNSPLFVAMIGSAMHGADDEKWNSFAEKVQAAGGDEAKLMETIFDSMPPTMSQAVRSLACIPPQRPISLSALMTFWQPFIGPDRNKQNAVLAQVLECGVGRLIIEEEYCFLLHPLVAEYLHNGVEGDPDAVIIKTYADGNGIPETFLTGDREHVGRWTQVAWDGYFHTYGPSHMAKNHPELVANLYLHPQWILNQHEACKIDKLLCDIKNYGSKCEAGVAIEKALESSLQALRRHPWEISTQLLQKLGDEESDTIRSFCAGLQEHARPADPNDKNFLWLRPIHVLGGDAPCTCVGFYKEYIVSGYENGTVQLWSLKDGSKVKTLLGHKAAVHGVVITKSGELATGSKNEELGSRIRKWNIETGECEVLGMLDRPDPSDKPTKAFEMKVSLGETGTDIKDYDQDTFGYDTRHTVRDTVLVEHEKDDETINCHTFMGWNSHLVCASATSQHQLNEARGVEHNGRFLVAAAGNDGNLTVYMLMTNDVPMAAAQDDSSD